MTNSIREVGGGHTMSLCYFVTKPSYLLEPLLGLHRAVYNVLESWILCVTDFF